MAPLGKPERCVSIHQARLIDNALAVSQSDKPSLCITLTSPFVLNAFLLGHLRHLGRGMRVTVCVNVKESDIPVDLPGHAELHPVEIRREISPCKDLGALYRLWRFYRDRHFDAVLTVTPKGGLLGMIAARLAGVPVRIHWFTGQIWATKTGFSRKLLKTMDIIVANCATNLLADSPSQKDFLVRNKVVHSGKISVLGQGSISGVDTARFREDRPAGDFIRKKTGIMSDAVCLLYVGRMKREKGVLDLLEAFQKLRQELPKLHLILVGPDEEGLLHNDGIDSRVTTIGYTKCVESYMAAADLICLPSYREGFGSVLIEAASVGLPAVASRIYGITDAVVEGETGLLHRAGDVDDLADCLRSLSTDDGLRRRMSENASKRVRKHFASSTLEDLFGDYLVGLLRRRKASAVRTSGCGIY